MQNLVDSRDVTPENVIRKVWAEFLPGGEKVEIKWEWPISHIYASCIVFEVPEERDIRGITLQELIDEKIKTRTVDRNRPIQCKYNLTREGKIYYVYPVRYDERDGEKRYILKQTGNNKTGVCRLRVCITPVIKYEAIRTGLLAGLLGLGG